MGQPSFTDDALIVLGHGSTQNADSGAPVFQNAAALRSRRIFKQVREGFWKQEPRISEVLSGLTESRVFIAPLFVSEGYFSEQVIPQALGFRLPSPENSARSLMHNQQRWLYCRPVGSHESMTNVLLARAKQVVEKFPFPRAPKSKDISLFIAGHGTEQNENSRMVIERAAKLIRAANSYAAVEAVFLEEPPRISDCFELAKTKNIVMVPFFMSDGMHVKEDMPVALGEPERIIQLRLEKGQATWRNPTEKRGKLVWLSSSIGSESVMADVILERVREAAVWASNCAGSGDPAHRGPL